jgi:aspartyl-tRNA(Asn)/glutamyl-tRNA(Gln) amidotransferase subunit A
VTLPTVSDHHRAYTAATHTPLEVAERFLKSDPLNGPFCSFIEVDPDLVLAQAAESTQWLRDGAAPRPLEGILVGVKDFIDVAGYSSRGGTGFLSVAAEQDEVLVARLKAAGAIVAGKQRTTELGLSPVGVNPLGGTPRNPHDLSRPCGGSSSGAGAAVAAGLAPLSIGTDGGGSVRIPPALCGVFGLKPTFGRVPRNGRMDVGWWTLDHPGPIARCAEDLATAFSVLSASEPLDLGGDAGIRVGVDWRWWGVPDSSVDEACRGAVEPLEPVPVEIEHIGLADVAERVSVVAEVATAVWEQTGTDPSRLSPTLRLLLAAAHDISAVEYLRAQQARTLLAREFASVFAEVDVLVTPTTACVAPALTEREMTESLFDDELLGKLTAYTFPANLTGCPALSVPVGTDPAGLPVGLQLMAPWDREDVLLGLAARLEREGVATCPPPTHRHDPL